MNNYFDENLVEQFFPEAGQLMFPSMKIWKLPPEKKDMLSDICDQGAYFLEEKIDGGFYQYVKTTNHSYLFGRTISVTTGLLTEKSSNVPHIKDAFDSLPANTILVGEIYVPGGTSKDVTHIMGCLPEEAIKRQNSEGLIHYYVHDILMYDGVDLISCGAEERYNILAAIWKKHDFEKYKFLRLAAKVDDNQEEELSRILNRGGEGVVLKRRDAPYSPGKRPAWYTIKIKEHNTIDLVCTKLYGATRDYSGKLDLGPNYTGKDVNEWPYWAIFKKKNPDDEGFSTLDCILDIGERKVVKSVNYATLPVTKGYFYGWKTSIGIGAYNDDGELVELGTVSSGLTEDTQRLMTAFPGNYLGKVVALECMSIDKKEHTLRHPVLKYFRGDKDAKDCLINEVFA